MRCSPEAGPQARTGGNSGIGLGIACGVAGAGASVAIWSRRAERNAEAAAELEGLGATAISVQCDVSDEDNVAGAMRETLGRFGHLDCLVADAGTTGASGNRRAAAALPAATSSISVPSGPVRTARSARVHRIMAGQLRPHHPPVHLRQGGPIPASACPRRAQTDRSRQPAETSPATGTQPSLAEVPRSLRRRHPRMTTIWSHYVHQQLLSTAGQDLGFPARRLAHMRVERALGIRISIHLPVCRPKPAAIGDSAPCS